MTKLSLRERFEQLGQIRGINPVHSGSPEIVTLRLSGSLRDTKSVDAVIALRRRGVPTLKAKRVVEAAMDGKTNVVDVPTVENARALANELKSFGFSMSLVSAHAVNVRAIRDRLGLTQEQFALRFGLELDALRNWEHGRREPDSAARSYLAVIEKNPDAVQDALAVAVV
jgi:DNA-binding transcriptional regulator YiaG